MRTLVLFRHAEAGQASSDHERPLSPGGERDARAAGRFLSVIDQVPQVAVVSSAKRAQQTFESAATAGDWAIVPRLDRRLYESTADRVVEVIREQSDGTTSLLLVGHQPTWSDLVEQFTGLRSIGFSAGSVVRIDLGVSSWSDVDYGCGHLEWFYPSRLWHRGGLAGLLGEAD